MFITHDKPTLAGSKLVPLGYGRWGVPIMAGGDPASPVAYPLGPPSISGTEITVDDLLNEPTRITRDIADLTMLGYWADRVFAGGGGVDGGAVLFERPNPLNTDLFANRDIKEVAPGDEFPLLGFERGVPMIARPRKFGGKWFVTKEARKRNDVSLLTRYMRQTSNTIRRRTEALAIAELAAVITSEGRFRTIATADTSWTEYAALTEQNRPFNAGPVSDILTTQNLIDLEQRGIILNGIILHPNQNLSLQQVYGPDQVNTVLSDIGITERFVTPAQTAGTATMYASGQVGEWRNEFPLDQETWEDGEGRQRTWYQWSISPAMFVNDPFAIYEMRGLEVVGA